MGAAWAGNGLIGGKAEVRAALDRVHRQGQTRGATALLAQPVTTGTDSVPATTDLLPCDPRLRPLLPHPGLRRGTTIAAVGSLQLAMLLLAGAMRDTGSWSAVVGVPEWGVLAAADAGVPVHRMALVPEPGPDWPTVVAALLDGVDLVVVQPPPDLPATLMRSLAARARRTGAVLIPTRPVPGVDLTLEVTDLRWHGLDHGSGRLRCCNLAVRASGRGKGHRSRTATITTPPGGHRRVHFPPPRTPCTTDPAPANPLWDAVEPTAFTDPWERVTVDR